MTIFLAALTTMSNAGTTMEDQTVVDAGSNVGGGEFCRDLEIMESGETPGGFNESGMSGAGDVKNFHWQKQ